MTLRVSEVYLAAVLCLGVLATLLTTWVLHLYHTPSHKPIPRIYRTFASYVTNPLGHCNRCWRRKKKGTESDDVTAKSNVRRSRNQVQPLDRDITILPLSKMEYDDNQYDRSQQYDAGVDRYEAVAPLEGIGMYNGLGQYSNFEQYNCVEQDGMTRQHHSHSEGSDRKLELTWQDLAVLFDRFFLWTFGVLLFVTTLFMILILYKDY